MKRPTSKLSRNRTSTTGNSIGAWLIVGGICLGLVSIFTVAGLTLHSKGHTDPKTLCPSKGPTAVTVILVDATDTIRPIQQIAVTNHLEKISEQMEVGERIELYEIKPGSQTLKPVFSMCRPASVSETNSLSGNRRLAAQRFDETFKPAVAMALKNAFSEGPADKSPIMEAIQIASVSSFQSPDLKAEVPRRLVIVSDMLENGAGGSQYRGLPDLNTYLDSPEYARTRSDLTNVDVTLLYLRRDDGAEVQGLKHVNFWTAWFVSQGVTANHFRATPIEG